MHTQLIHTNTCSPFVQRLCSCPCLVSQDNKTISMDVARHLWRGGGCTWAKQLLSSARLSVAKSDGLFGATTDFQLDRRPCGQVQRIWQGNQLTLLFDWKKTEFITRCRCEIASSCLALSSEASILFASWANRIKVPFLWWFGWFCQNCQLVNKNWGSDWK